MAGSKGFPDLSTPYATWTSFRIMAPMMEPPGFSGAEQQRCGASERSGVEHFVSPHIIAPINDCSEAAPFGVNSHANAPQFNNTVIQKTERNDCFWVLWRNVCWAISAPGQPPANDRKCSVLSCVLHAPTWAADLSSAYMMTVSKLVAMYSARIWGGILERKTEVPTMMRNRVATTIDRDPLLRFVFSGSLSPVKVALSARGRPFLS